MTTERDARRRPLALLTVLGLAALCAGCAEARNHVVAGGATTTFALESVLSRSVFGGSARRWFEIEVDNSKLAEQRPLAIGEIVAFRRDGERADPARLEGFIWYLPGNHRVLIGIGERSRKPDERVVYPILVGDYDLQHEGP